MKLALVWLACCGASLIPAQPARFSVDNPRPVAEAIERLEYRNGWRISYEDLPYVHESDMSYYPANAKDPVLRIPAGGSISLNGSIVAPDGRGLTSQEAVVQAVLAAEAIRRGFAAFRLLKDGSQLHVVPAARLGVDGHVERVSPVLDTYVSVRGESTTALDFLDMLCEALSATSGETVGIGAVPLGLLHQTRIDLPAAGKARDLLASVLDQSGEPLSWQLFYDPGLKWHMLNIHVIRGALSDAKPK